MKIKNRNNNLSNFLFFTISILLATCFLIALLTIKNECLKTHEDIQQLHKLQTSSLNTVKELQSNKEFLMSEKYISNYLSGQMTVVVPETLIIEVELSK